MSHAKDVSITVLQSGWLLVHLEEQLQNSLVCTSQISLEFSFEQLRLRFLSSDLPALEFVSALVILSAQAKDFLQDLKEDIEFLDHEQNF